MIGETLGSYRVVAKLGEGGMGTVYAGEHVVLGRRVAIKLLLPSLSSNQELLQRFFNEARATATLDHPGLVQVLDYGQAPGGSAFLVMELLTGETIARRLARVGRLDYASAAGFCRQAAAAVGVAHAAGIVHRDLKPDNLFLVRDAEIALGERVKVLDFGIAKLTDTTSGISSMTRTGAVLGTPYYMSPEQCRGAGEVDHRSDIYALGCILFEMVCGRPPFTGAGTGEIIGAHIYQDRPNPRAFDPGLPPALEAIIGRAMQKDPGARQQSMQELGAELDAAAARGGTQGRPAAAVGGPGWQAGAAPLGFAATAANLGPGHPATGHAAVGPATGGHVMSPAPMGPAPVGYAPMGHVAAPQTTLGGATGQRAPGAARRSWLVPAVIAGVLGSAAAGGAFYLATSGDDKPAKDAPVLAKRGEGEEPAPPQDQPPVPAPAPAPAPAPPPAPTPAGTTDTERAIAQDLLPGTAKPAPARPAPTHAAPRPTPKSTAAARPAPPPPERPAAAMPFAPRQRWSGHYVCPQGKTALSLQIASVQENTVDAVFEFSHAESGAVGSFRVTGPYDPAHRRLTLFPGAWIRQPGNYQTVGLAGVVSADGSVFAGSIRSSACSSFVVHR